jgi:hypothetical protein
MSQLFIVFALFIAQALGQAPQPDANCTAWLATPTGQNFTTCESGFPGLPMKTPDNNCLLTQTDFDLLCNDSCYQIMLDAYNFILETGTCLELYEYYFGPCQVDGDCVNAQLGPQVCVAGVCMTSCDTTADCNSCNSETCETFGSVSACQSNLTQTNGNSTFRGNFYQFQSTCSQNDDGDSCGLLFSNITDNLSNVTCSDFDSWGCCLGQMLTNMEFCAFQRFTSDSIYNCSSANQTCSDYPRAQQFCSIIGTNSTTNTSSSSGVSSGSSSMTGSSSHLSSHTGSGVGTGNNNGTGSGAETIAISWSLLLGLILITPTFS